MAEFSTKLLCVHVEPFHRTFTGPCPSFLKPRPGLGMTSIQPGPANYLQPPQYLNPWPAHVLSRLTAGRTATQEYVKQLYSVLGNNMPKTIHKAMKVTGQGAVTDRPLSQVGTRRKRCPGQFGQDGMGSIPATPSTKHASCFPPSSMPASIEISIKLIIYLSDWSKQC